MEGERKSTLRKSGICCKRPYHTNRISRDTQLCLSFQHHTTMSYRQNGRIWRKTCILTQVTRGWLKEKTRWACLPGIPKVSSRQESVCYQKSSEHFHPEAQLLQCTLLHLRASHLGVWCGASSVCCTRHLCCLENTT